MDYISADVEEAGQPAWAPNVGEGPAKEGPHLPGDLLTLTPGAGIWNPKEGRRKSLVPFALQGTEPI